MAPPEVSSSQLTNAETLSRQTESGVVMGTVVYMSPEQVSGMKVDHRSDIFAFGAILFEMLSGERPFQGKSQVEVMHAILKTDAPDLQLTNSDVPAALDRIVHRCLEKNPDRRFQSTSDLAFALEALSSSSGRSTAAAFPRGLKSLPRRVLRYLISGLLALAAVIATFYAGKEWGQKFLPSANPTGSPSYTWTRVTFRNGLLEEA